jgi:hypothetical protein
MCLIIKGNVWTFTAKVLNHQESYNIALPALDHVSNAKASIKPS